MVICWFVLSGNAADDAYVKCLAAMPLGMFFRSHMLSGNAAPPRPLTIRKLLSLRADVGLKRKGRPRARQKGYTGRSALGDKTSYYMPTAVMRSISTHFARHMPHSKRV